MDVFGIGGKELDSEEAHTVAIRHDTWEALVIEANIKGWTTEHLIGIICEAHVRRWE